MADRMGNIAGLFKEGRTRTIILVTLIALVIAIVIGIVSMRSRTKGVEAAAGFTQTPGNIQSVPFQAPNPEYARLQEKQNAQQAKTAEQTGGSAIPTIVSAEQYKGPIPADTGESLGFTALSREQSNTGTFSPKEFGGAQQDLKNCPLVQPQSPLGTPIYDKNGRLIGYAGPDGKVRDVNGNIIGTVGPDGLVRDANGNVIGQPSSAASGTPVYDDKCNIVGYVDDNKNVRDTAGNVLGRLESENLLKNANGKTLGRAGVPSYDTHGKLLGFACSDGKVRDANGNVIGTVGPDGVVRDLNGNIIGKAGAISPGTPIYDANGNIIGYVGPDGKVRDANGNVIGTVGIDGQVRDAAGNIIGSIVKPEVSPLSKEAAAGVQTAAAMAPEQIAAQQMQDSYQRQQEILKDQKLSQVMQQKQSAMAAQAGQLLAAWTSPIQQYVPGNSEQSASGGGENGGEGQGGSGAPSKAGAVFIKAGTVYYGTIDTAVDSDEPGPVMASILSGPYKGGKLLGALTNQGKAVMFTFNIMTLPQFPKSFAVNVVAVDQNTARTALSTDTDNHYLLRYGSLFAASFVQGYGQALTTAGSTSSPTLLGQSVTTPQLSGPQKFYVALGNVGTQFSNQMNSVYSTPPTVRVASGTAVGVLFLNDVQLPTS